MYDLLTINKDICYNYIHTGLIKKAAQNALEVEVSSGWAVVTSGIINLCVVADLCSQHIGGELFF